MREAVVRFHGTHRYRPGVQGRANSTKSPSMLGYVAACAIQRAGVGGRKCKTRCSAPSWRPHRRMNVARNAVLAAGLPVTVAAPNDRPSVRLWPDGDCNRGPRQIIVDGMDIVTAGGQENISAVQKTYFDWASTETDPRVVAPCAACLLPMLRTPSSSQRSTESAAKRRILRARVTASNGLAQRQVASPLRLFFRDHDDGDRQGDGRSAAAAVVLDRDEGKSLRHHPGRLSALKPVIGRGSVSAGNSSQLSDGASACVLMEAASASRRGLQPLRSIEHDRHRMRLPRMGIGPSMPSPVAEAFMGCGSRHRAVGIERSVRLPGPLLSRQLGIDRTSTT